MTLRKEFSHLFPPSAFGTVSGDEAIIGRWGNIVRMEDGSWDFWIIGRDGSPLNEHRIHAVTKKLQKIAPVIRLDGEAYGSVRGLGNLVKVARILGVRRKQGISDARRAELSEQAKRMRAAQA